MARSILAKHLPAHLRALLKKQDAGKGIKVARVASHLEGKFDQLWQAMGGPELEKEQELVPGRKWRWDRCNRLARVAVEIHGQVWVEGKGGHTSGRGFHRDRQKMTAMQESGWVVYELIDKDITTPFLERIAGFMRERTPADPTASA